MVAVRLEGFTFGYIPDELLFSRASSNAKVIYGVLTRYVYDQNRQDVFPSQETLRKRLGWSPSTIKRAIAELAQLGWLTKRQCRVTRGERDGNVYTLRTKRTVQRKWLRRRRSNLTPGADQGKHAKPAGQNRRSNLTHRTRENEFAGDGSRLDGASRPPAVRRSFPNKPMTTNAQNALRETCLLMVNPEWELRKVERLIQEGKWSRLREELFIRRPELYANSLGRVENPN